MNRVASKFAVEILVHFEKRDRNSAPHEKKSEYGSARPASGNATGSLLTVDNLSVSSLRLNRIEKLRRQAVLLCGEISGKASGAVETAIRNWPSRQPRTIVPIQLAPSIPTYWILAFMVTPLILGQVIFDLEDGIEPGDRRNRMQKKMARTVQAPGPIGF